MEKGIRNLTRLIRYFNSLNKYVDKSERQRILKIYNTWVKNQTESIIDGSYCDAWNECHPDKPHHVRTANNSGTSMKPNDLWQVPLTYIQHHQQETTHRATYQIIFLAKLPELHDRFIEECDIKVLSEHESRF